MNPIFPRAARILPKAPLPVAMAPVNAVPALWQQDRNARIARVTALAPEDAAAGLLWLAMTFPATPCWTRSSTTRSTTPIRLVESPGHTDH